MQEQASLAGFRLDDKSVKTLVDWLANGADEEELQQLFNAVDTGVCNYRAELESAYVTST